MMPAVFQDIMKWFTRRKQGLLSWCMCLHVRVHLIMKHIVRNLINLLIMSQNELQVTAGLLKESYWDVTTVIAFLADCRSISVYLMGCICVCMSRVTSACCHLALKGIEVVFD